jgi:serine/threonine protein kinase/predicted Zn-dependent protease
MTPDAENWELLQDLFHLAEVTPAEDRERVLAQRCPDEKLRRRALRIFTASSHEEPVSSPPREDSSLGSKIGPYTLIRHLGTGGIGAVYLVERMAGGVVQRSALKVLAPHSAGPSFIERFHREQHILATLDHPNITRMLDAGLSDSGQPYLVMEYVDGMHLDAYCDQHRLGIPERLQLFLQVCDAVAYAHRNLVVHLDLKPSNILVTADGAIKLLDFGTSKLIQPDSRLTTTVMATPAYASPEQLRNEAVTTSCDIYALGGILFELLAGSRPGSSASAAAMIERAILEQEPERLPAAVTAEAAEKRGLSESRFRQILTGDLATIVEKCLRPRPRDRYSSIDSLAADIQRYLTGRPVQARPQTTLYWLSKFVRRNRGALAATALVVVLLIGSVAYAGWRQEQAVREGQRALRMQTFMYRLFKLANSSYTGKQEFTVPEFLELGVKLLPDFIKNPADLREGQMGLAESMYENGDLDSAQRVFEQIISSAKAAGDVGAEAEAAAFAGDIAFQTGRMDEGKAQTAQALELSRKPGVPPSVRVWSDIYYAANREKNGFRTDENVSLLQAAVKECHEYNLPERETAFATYQLAEDYEMRGRLSEATQLIQEDIDIYNREPYAVCDQSQMYEDLAYLDVSRMDIADSLPLFQKAYDGLKACSGPDKRNTLMVQALMAGAMIRLGQAKEAVPILEGSMPAWRKVAGNSPDMFNPMYYLATAYVATGRYAEGEAVAKELMGIMEGKVAPNNRRLGAVHFVWAKALAGQHRYQEALPHLQVADKLTENGISPYAQQVYAEVHQLLLDVQAKTH